MTFWIALVALTLFAVGLSVAPLILGGRQVRTNTEEKAQLAVLRDRRDEIEADRQSGRLTKAEADSAQQELVDALAESLTARAPAAPEQPAGLVNSTKITLFAAAFLVITIPVVSYVTYATVGQPEIGVHLADNDFNQQPTAGQLASMVEEIEARTRSHPNDGEAWLALAQVRKIQGNLPATIAAFERAVAVGPPDAGVMADYAETIALTQQQRFGGKPQEILQRAYELDPEHIKVNALLGASYYQSGQHTKALPFLKRFVARIDPASEQAVQINRLIAGIESGPQQAAQMGSPNHSGTATGQTDNNRSKLKGGLIRGSVSITGPAPGTDATLFISARLASGPRMPFAAIRLPTKQFPLNFELSDANAMSPNRKLSSADQVVVEARISQSGQAMRQSGDRFGVSQVVKPGDATVTIQIDKTVP